MLCLSFFPRRISVEFMLLFVSFVIFLQIPLQRYLLYFGYVTNFLAEAGLAAVIAYYLNKLPGYLYLPYSASVSVMWFYVLGRPYEIPQVAMECLITLIPLYYHMMVKVHDEKSRLSIKDGFFWKLALLMVLIVITLVSFNPLVVFLSLINRSQDYSGSGLCWWVRLLIAGMNAAFTLVAGFIRPKIVAYKIAIQSQITKRYEFEEEEGKKASPSLPSPDFTSQKGKREIFGEDELEISRDIDTSIRQPMSIVSESVH